VVARVGAERFAFRVADVEEALDAPRILPVPGAAPGLVGQIRHRDRTVAAFDGRWAFGVETGRLGDRETGRPEDRGGRGGSPGLPVFRSPGLLSLTALILRRGDHRSALLVDDVDDLAILDASRLRPAPAGTDPEGVLHGVALERAAGVGLLGVVNVANLLARVERLAVAPAEGAL